LAAVDENHTYTGWAQKWGHKLVAVIRSVKFERILKKSLVNLWLNKYENPYRTLHALPCETLMSAKQAINDKLQGSVATSVRCGGVVNSQIKKGLLLSQ